MGRRTLEFWVTVWSQRVTVANLLARRTRDGDVELRAIQRPGIPVGELVPLDLDFGLGLTPSEHI